MHSITARTVPVIPPENIVIARKVRDFKKETLNN